MTAFYSSEKLDFERFSRQSKNFFKMCGNPYKKVFCFIESWNWVSTIPTRRGIDITVWQLLLKSFLFQCLYKQVHVVKEFRISPFKETVCLTSTYDTREIIQDQSKNSYHKMGQNFTKNCVRTVMGLKYVVMFLMFATRLNWQLFWRMK